MQAKAAEEGEKEEKLYEKFMCYCENKECDLTSTEKAKANIESLGTEIKKPAEKKSPHGAGPEGASSHADAKVAMVKTTALRGKWTAIYAAKSLKNMQHRRQISQTSRALQWRQLQRKLRKRIRKRPMRSST